MIKIDFEMTHPIYGTYKDAIHLSENHTLTDDDIENIKKARFEAWLDHIKNPPVSSNCVTIDGEDYELLRDVPPPGAKVVEVNGTWYFKV